MTILTNGATHSLWHDTVTLPEYPPLSGPTETGVCVVGAGIAGLTTAYQLLQRGHRVVLIDAIGIGAGETGRTTAHFFPPDEWYAGIEGDFGAAAVRRVAEGFARATEWVERTVRLERIDCGFERLDGYLLALPGDGFRDLDREVEAARRAGVAAERLDQAPGLPFDTGPCVRYPDQAQFHPLRYLRGLAEAVVRLGGRIHGGTRATAVEGDATRQVVTTTRGRIGADAVVVATHTPFNNRVALHAKQAGYHTYVVGLEVPRGVLPRVLLWDTGDPYHYVRLETPDDDADHEVLIVGGADHKVGEDGHPEHRWDEIERWTRERFPMAGACRWRWSGEVMEPSDGLGLLGRNPGDDPNVYVITGDSGNGMAHTTLGALIVTDLIEGRENPMADLFDPARKPVHGLGDLMSEQADVVRHYGEWVTGGEVDSPAEIAPGQGAVVRQGLHKLAVYRGEDGGLQALSATCTHLGCIVHWNSAERSWDCPCHGSRFGLDGQVLHGPAATPLQAASLDPPSAPPGGTAHPGDPRGAGRPGR